MALWGCTWQESVASYAVTALCTEESMLTKHGWYAGEGLTAMEQAFRTYYDGKFGVDVGWS